MELKLGKQPATIDHRDLRFADFQTGKPKIAPKGFGHWPAVTKKLHEQWGYLGNDRYGDCVFAGSAHETMLWNAMQGKAVLFDDHAVLSDYAAVTGFDPVTGANDNGANMRDAMNYRRHTGIVDASGHRHKIAAYVALEPGNWQELLIALWDCDQVAIGFEVPESAMQQFMRGKVWSYIGDHNIIGGHYVPIQGHYAISGVYANTWNKLQKMTRKFYENYCDEAYACISLEAFSGKGKTPEGFDLDGLKQALTQL